MGSTGYRDKVRAYRDALPACRDLLVGPCDGLACCWGEAGRGFKRLVYRVRGNDEVAMLRSRRRRDASLFPTPEAWIPALAGMTKWRRLPQELTTRYRLELIPSRQDNIATAQRQSRAGDR